MNIKKKLHLVYFLFFLMFIIGETFIFWGDLNFIFCEKEAKQVIKSYDCTLNPNEVGLAMNDPDKYCTPIYEWKEVCKS